MVSLPPPLPRHAAAARRRANWPKSSCAACTNAPRGGLHSQHLFDEALRHALAAGDLDLAVQVVEEGLPDALNREDWLTLERWLRCCPPALVETRPWLLMLKAWILQFTWQLGAQLRVLDQIEALLDQPGPEQIWQRQIRQRHAACGLRRTPGGARCSAPRAACVLPQPAGALPSNS